MAHAPKILIVTAMSAGGKTFPGGKIVEAFACRATDGMLKIQAV
jgi:hypothetical protein